MNSNKKDIATRTQLASSAGGKVQPIILKGQIARLHEPVGRPPLVIAPACAQLRLTHHIHAGHPIRTPPDAADHHRDARL